MTAQSEQWTTKKCSHKWRGFVRFDNGKAVQFSVCQSCGAKMARGEATP